VAYSAGGTCGAASGECDWIAEAGNQIALPQQENVAGYSRRAASRMAASPWAGRRGAAGRPAPEAVRL
jgi:hypothetical protein